MGWPSIYMWYSRCGRQSLCMGLTQYFPNNLVSWLCAGVYAALCTLYRSWRMSQLASASPRCSGSRSRSRSAGHFARLADELCPGVGLPLDDIDLVNIALRNWEGSRIISLHHLVWQGQETASLWPGAVFKVRVVYFPTSIIVGFANNLMFCIKCCGCTIMCVVSPASCHCIALRACF